jgi:two-component system KDP operon response regulator KdpE
MAEVVCTRENGGMSHSWHKNGPRRGSVQAREITVRAKGKRILVVDDEPPIQRTLRRNLMASGYEVLIAENGAQALEIALQHQPDLILLDLYMPGDIAGLDVCVRVREVSRVPIIVLSAANEEKLKVRALDLGADDYLTKPFSQEELQARVRACLRRAQISMMANEKEPQVLVTDNGYLSMDIARRQVRAGDQEVRLTPTEFELLQQLMLNAGKVLTHRALLRAVWGPEYGEEADYLRVYIRQLRLKIEVEPSRPQYIITEPGIGYVFRMNVGAASS